MLHTLSIQHIRGPTKTCCTESAFRTSLHSLTASKSLSSQSHAEDRVNKNHHISHASSKERQITKTTMITQHTSSMMKLGRCRFRCTGLARSTLFLSTFGGCLQSVMSFSSHSFCTSQVSIYPNPTKIIGKRLSSFPTVTKSSSPIRRLASSNNQDEQAMTRDAMQIVQHAIAAVDPYAVIRSNIVREENVLNFKNANFKLDLSTDYDEIILVSFGKASSAMSTSVLNQIFPSKIDLSCRGVVICKDGHVTQNEKECLIRHGVEIYEASHPVPDDRSIEAADRLIELVSSCASDRSLVICCISGGGSSLFCRPTEPLTIDDLQQVNSILLASGMSIQEMNVLRKRLENGKGGRLAASCFPSHVVALILSDVVGDPLDLIASGPTVPDKSDWQDGWDIVKQYNLEEKLPKAVLEMLQEGLDGKLEDSPSSNHPIFKTTENILVGNNALAVQAASESAKMLGYQPVVLGTEIEGEAKEVAKIYIAMSSYLQSTLAKNKYDEANQQESHHSVPYTIAQSLPVALIAGGGMSKLHEVLLPDDILRINCSSSASPVNIVVFSFYRNHSFAYSKQW